MKSQIWRPRLSDLAFATCVAAAALVAAQGIAYDLHDLPAGARIVGFASFTGWLVAAFLSASKSFIGWPRAGLFTHRTAPLVAAISLVLYLVAVGLIVIPSRGGSSTIPTRLETAKQQLAKLSVRRPLRLPYLRGEAFPKSWGRIDECDTRDLILRRDLKDVIPKQGCTVKRGILDDSYTGQTIDFVLGVSSKYIQIDHVVAVKDAWRSGAAKWTPTARMDYYNDPVVLLAVDRSSNASKQDKDASRWLPPSDFYECSYVEKQIKIKTKYRLSVTQAEYDEMAEVLATCLR